MLVDAICNILITKKVVTILLTRFISAYVTAVSQQILIFYSSITSLDSRNAVDLRYNIPALEIIRSANAK